MQSSPAQSSDALSRWRPVLEQFAEQVRILDETLAKELESTQRWRQESHDLGRKLAKLAGLPSP